MVSIISCSWWYSDVMRLFSNIPDSKSIEPREWVLAQHYRRFGGASEEAFAVTGREQVAFCEIYRSED